MEMIPTGWFTIGIIIAIIVVLSLMRHVDKRDYRDSSLKTEETKREILERVTAELVYLRRAVRSRETQIERLIKEINEDENS